ncbi:LuxR C-terminal-related transcriptional regulator [Antarcticibacterium sp. 1MA-6-2]|uniref:helix-turn-helix and ligand-binding sensor domain-containing protein n=1 Tax=Antarcticibacterium sp. 1MA-6-2 TaxID=2908210 RepID=UPI001F20F9CE|nr:triple tyrosine motif-containing protein [Antarcticibacterium sp. 1MA-6-2]UJH90605.1 LuxR C-terminal-related transcriptional regulator [Antarcticibacterium sp. 1MA-6-2]
MRHFLKKLFYLNFALAVIYSSCGLAQDLPPIQNFGPLDYSGEYQNWAITQSHSKKIYVANHTSLMEYDGVRWKKYKLPLETIIRSVHAVGERIYMGCYEEFGYWARNQKGILEYTSISNKFKSQILDNEEFWDILVVNSSILFQSLDRIYIYDLETEKLSVIEAKTEKAKLFEIGSKVYFQKKEEGLFTLENGKAVLVSDAGEIKNSSIINIFDTGNNLLMITYDGIFYSYSSGKFELWNSTINERGIKMYSAIRLSDGSFALGTISDGLYHMSAEGEIIENIKQANGLNNNTVLSLFEDVDENLWLGLDNGVSIINLNSPFKEYTDRVGNLGLVYAALKHNGHLYLGTNQGLFVKAYDSKDKFSLIKGTEGQVWSLQLVNNTVFCGHNSGTFVISNDQAQLVSTFPGTWVVKQIPFKEDLVIQGNYNGLSILENKAGNWSLKNVIDGFEISSRFFEMDSLKMVVNHEHQGLYYLELDPDLKEVRKIKNTARQGYGSNIFEYNGDLIYKTHEGIYNLDYEGKEFQKEESLNQLIFEENKKPISRIITNANEPRLWYFTENGISYLDKNTITGKAITAHIPAAGNFITNLGVAGFENITYIGPNLYLIGISNGYVSLDLDKIDPQEYQIEINAVYNGDYENTSNTYLNTEGNYDYRNNNLGFEFSVPEFDKYIEVKYQYKLEGLDEDWNEWSYIPEATYKNLNYGDYEFSVRAMVGNQLSNNLASYKFSIARPWYASNLAIVLYSLGLLLIIFSVHKSYKKYYRRKHDLLIAENEKVLEQRRLEEQAKISKILNINLRNEIESKNRELAISTMSIVKKNEFLSAIKSQLNSVNEKEKAVSTVIRKIDQNLNSEEDWKFFEVAFNNADKDFLLRIKANHENLTHNDLKLCAYLRLNLSSKEIAPLLNISAKSVEMKRYRLRQKLNLSHEDNLMDYILNF